MVVRFAAAVAAGEDDLLGVEEFDDESGDAFDGFVVEGAPAMGTWLNRHLGFGVAGGEGVHVGED